MTRIALAPLVLLVLVLAGAACGNGDDAPDAPRPDAPLPDADIDASPFPPFPELGAQLDRAGRPLVAPALVAAFETDVATRDTAKDDFNADGPADASTWTATIAEALAVWDALGATCGNQLMAGAGATRYDALAALLADDQLYVDTTKTTCGTFLAVERGLDDCGGRLPSVDAVDAFYSPLISDSAALGDGVPSDPDGPPSSTFPFLLP